MLLELKIFQILKNNNFLKDKKVGIAVSCGVDSMALLDILRRIRKKYNLELYVLHYNHKWRRESYRESKLIKNYCEKFGLNFIYKENKGRVIKKEEEARNERSLFFKEAALNNKLDVICTAHHKDDQIETIIFRLARGTGPKGVLPIKDFLKLSDRLIFYRPFLDVTKEQIYKYATKHNIQYIQDKTNKDIKYKRNLIRRKIIPLLKKINSKAENNILNCFDLIYSQNEVLNKSLSLLVKQISIRSSFRWNRRKFLDLDEYTQKSLLYWFLTSRCIKGNLNKINTVRDAIKNLQNINLSKQHSVKVDKKIIHFTNKKNEIMLGYKNTQKEINLSLNGKISSVSLDNKNYLVLTPVKIKRFNGKFPLNKEKIAYVDLSSFKDRILTLRYRKPGDYFAPFGFSGMTKLKKYLINKKITREKRYNLPLLCCGNEVLWIPGYSLSEKVKVHSKPTHVLKLGIKS